MTEAEVLAMEVAPPLHSSWEDDELSDDGDLDTARPPVLATHHRRDASADASPPRSPSRKDDTPDATQANGGLTKQQKRAARLALDTATQVVQAAAAAAVTAAMGCTYRSPKQRPKRICCSWLSGWSRKKMTW